MLLNHPNPALNFSLEDLQSYEEPVVKTPVIKDSQMQNQVDIGTRAKTVKCNAANHFEWNGHQVFNVL